MTKGLFLDCDGVINREIGYLHRVGEVEFVDGIFDLCRFFQERDYRLFIVTNQAGVARGFYTEEDVVRLHDWLAAEFALKDVRFTAMYYCPHHPTAGLGSYRIECLCRKPAPGMILRAQREHEIELS